MRSLDVATSSLGCVSRYPMGMYLRTLGPRPEKLLQLYDFEACPFCRKAREMLTMLDLDARIFPCPKGGTRFRPIVQEKGGKTRFPYLVDDNTGVAMYGSMDIARYLAKTYGDGRIPFMLSLGPLTTFGSAMTSLVRFWRGGRVRPSRAPAEPLELYSFEISPYCRLVRETLCELEIPYVLHNLGKRSPHRKDFIARSGKMRVPYLVDPNTKTEMFESADICRYLDATYAT